MSDSRFQTNRKIELHENIRLNDKINELQNAVRHNRRQRLKIRENEDHNRLFIRQDSRDRLCRAIYEIRTKNQLSLQIKQNAV